MISLIVPTLGTRMDELNRLFDSLDNQTYKEIEAIVVSQANWDVVENLLEGRTFKYKHVKTNIRGLSFARNEGLQYVSGDILTFADDDCWYPNNAFEVVCSKMLESNYEIGCFQYFDPIGWEAPRVYAEKEKEKINRIEILQKCSIEIFINLEKVSNEDLLFDTRFGVGAEYPRGEDTILLMDLYEKKYCISYIPKIVVYHPCKERSRSFTQEEWSIKGIVCKRMFKNPLVGLSVYILLTVRKFHRLDHPVGTLVEGIKKFITFKK